MSAAVATLGTARSVGVVGGGQLARMLHQAAIGLGVQVTVLADAASAPAVRAGSRHLAGSPHDPAALRALAAGHDVVTFEHEDVPTAHLEALVRAGHAVHPAPAAKLLAQDKLAARRSLRELGLPVPAFAPAASLADVQAFGAGTRGPLVLKARRGGYDGRGVHMVTDAAQAALALAACDGAALVEERVPIARELAVLVARRPSGDAVAYPVVATRQRDGMCRETVAPAPVATATAARARALALELVEAVDATGIVAVELFLRDDGDLLVNELALRPHNAGHWTIEGAATSQFEQHLRAVLDLPLGATALRAGAAAMVNVIGRGDEDPDARLPAALAVPGAHVHLYAKRPRAGRKLGHVTALADDPRAALATARAAAARLEGA